MTKKLLLVLLALTLSVAGCGGSSDASSKKPSAPTTSASPTESPSNPADHAIAAASVLVLSDFPSGWEGKAVEKDDDSERTKRKIADCTGVDYEVLYGGDSGTVDSKDFTSSDDESISNRVQVHGTESDASETFEVASSEKYRSCLEKESKTYVEKLAEGEDDTKIGDPTFNELSFDDLGDATIAYRLTVPVKTQGYDVDIIADYVLVRVGRATTLITAQSTISPFDVDDLTNYAKIATDRLAAQLNGTPATSGS